MVSMLVEHEYIATEDDELSIHPGDIITDVVKQDGGWWEGVLKGKKGVFPDNFVKEIKAGKPPQVKKQTSVGGRVAEMANRLGMAGGIKMDTPVMKRESSTKKLGRAKVVYSYTPQSEDELALEVDTIVEVTSQVEDGWWHGVANDKQGLFPSNFVELIEEEPETEKIVQAKKVKGVGLGNIFGNAPIALRSHGVQPSVRRQGSPSAEKKDSPELKNKKGNHRDLPGTPRDLPTSPRDLPTSPRDLPTSPRDLPTSPQDAFADPPVVASKEPKETKRGDRARVLYLYKAENDDELSIAPNQIITVLCKSLDDSGWWRGELDGKVGVFPDNFVELLPEEVSKPKKPPPPPSAPKPADSGISHIKDVQDEKPVQSRKGKPSVPPPVGKKPSKCTDSTLLAPTDDDKANIGQLDLAKNGVEAADKPTAQVKGRITHHSQSAEHFHDQLEEGKDVKPPGETGEDEVPCPPPAKGACPTGELKHGRRFARQDRPLNQTPNEGDDFAPTDVPQGPKDDPKHSAAGHRTSRIPPAMPKEPPTQRPPKSVMLPHVHSKPASTEVTHAAPPVEAASEVNPGLVEELRHEIEHLKAASVSIAKYEALQQDVSQLREEFASLKSKMNARITDLMDEVDDEKKTRLTMQVEIERIRKLTKPT